jgi:hypothetical protein
MEAIKRYFRKWGVVAVVGLLIVFFVVEVGAMRMTPEQMKRAKGAVKKTMEELNQRKNSYFIYDKDNPENGIWVNKELAKENSKTIKFMAEYLDEETNKIALPCSVNIIKLGFDFLDNKVDIRKLLLGQLVDVANFFNFLEVPADKMKAVLVEIKENINKSDAKNINEELTKMPPELQELIMVDSAICLKNFIIKKHAQDRKIVFAESDAVYSVAFSSDNTKIVSGGWSLYPTLWDISNLNNITHQKLRGVLQNDIGSVAFSPDGTNIVSGSMGKLILWDVSNPHAITHQKLRGYLGTVLSVAFSPDGTKIISGGYGADNNLILWDISNPNAITHQQIGPQGGAVAFSPDGKNIVSNADNNLILWDISNPQNITQKTLIGHPKNVTAVAFSHDGTKIVSGCWGNQNNLILWDISNPNAITHHAITHHAITHQQNSINPNFSISLQGVRSVAFSPDDKNIVSGADGNQNNLILWDISNPNNITHQQLVGHLDSVRSVAFSPDGKNIVSGGGGRQNYLILWTLLTDQEEALLNQLKNNYTADQVRLVYLLCLQALKGHSIALKQGSEEQQIFMTLPEDMQNLLQDLLFPKGWFSGWR